MAASLDVPKSAFKPSEMIILRAKEETDANVRLTSMALHNGLSRRGIRSRVIRPHQSFPPLESSACIIFHYDDNAAIEAIRSARVMGLMATVACLGSDIYSFAEYVALHDLIDFYVVPTNVHRIVLSSQVYKPVYTLPEAIDRAALGESQNPQAFASFPNKSSREACWFGYSESFEKGMASLMPVINRSVANGRLDGFKVIVDEERFKNRFNVNTLRYNHNKFRAITQRFDYVILSHFALDLSLNSFIKSPNKAVTSLVAGLIPLATDTPSYGSLFRELGIERFLFSSPSELNDLIDGLDPVADSRLMQQLGVVENLLVRFSDETIAEQFLEIYQHSINRIDKLSDLPIQALPPPPRPEATFTEHLRDLGPSAVRMLRAKAGRGVALLTR